MKCRIEKGRAALLWIKKYSPVFENMGINLEQLELHPEYGFLNPTIVTIAGEEDTVIYMGPAPSKIGEKATDGTVP